MPNLVDAVDPDAGKLLDILVGAWSTREQWPNRQFVSHEMASAGLGLADVLAGLPEWGHHYQLVRVLRAANPVPGAPPELGDQIAPTVYGLMHCTWRNAAQLVRAFLAGVAVGYGQQQSLLPDPVQVKPVTLTADALTAGIRALLGPFGEVDGRQIRLMLAGEPATWAGVTPDPDSADWAWSLWFGSMQPFATDDGMAYLAALEELIGMPAPPRPAAIPVAPSALPRALDHLDLVWLLRTGQRLFKRPGFARVASLAEQAASGDEFEARCNALSDVLSMLSVPAVDGVDGSLNLLNRKLGQLITDPESFARASGAVDVLRLVVALRRGQAHAGASHNSLKAANRLGVEFTRNWPASWDRVRHATIDAIYVLIAELGSDLG